MRATDNTSRRFLSRTGALTLREEALGGRWRDVVLEGMLLRLYFPVDGLRILQAVQAHWDSHLIFALNAGHDLLFQCLSDDFQVAGVQSGDCVAPEAFDGALIRIEFAVLDIHEGEADDTVFVLAAETDECTAPAIALVALDVLIGAVDLFDEPLHG